jgi:hypothetical protein
MVATAPPARSAADFGQCAKLWFLAQGNGMSDI